MQKIENVKARESGGKNQEQKRMKSTFADRVGSS